MARYLQCIKAEMLKRVGKEAHADKLCELLNHANMACPTIGSKQILNHHSQLNNGKTILYKI